MGCSTKSRRDENTEATRGALLMAARELFGQHGYNGTSIEMVANAARVTTGAIYHHFESKKDLFLATAQALEEELRDEAESVEGPHLWDRLRAGYARMVERFSDPGVHRILFVEAPQVLCPGPWSEIELRYGYGTLRGVLQALIKKNVVRTIPAPLIARLLVGLLREASAELAASGGDPVVRAQVWELIDRVFSAIRVDPPPSQ
jgi:AcrR family transcriptional regulator